MARLLLIALLPMGLLGACSQGSEPAAATATPSAAEREQATAPAKAAEVAQPEPAVGDGPANPCSQPEARTLELSAGEVTTTPWGLELTYGIDEDSKRGPGFMFLLKHGARRWETRRDNGNWNTEMSWRGFCWRGGKRPGKRASRVQIQVAPICKNGQLVTVGGCADALAQVP